MASPPDPNAGHDGAKRFPTEKGKPGSSLIAAEEVTTATPAYSEDVTTTTPAVGDDVLDPPATRNDPLGSGRLDAGRSEPSSPSAVIGPITKKRKRTSPYQEASGELRLDPDAAPQEQKKKKSLPRRILKGVLWTIAIVLLLLLLVIGFFHTGPGKSVAKDLAEGALNKRYDGKVTIGELDYALFGDVEIKDLVIAEHGGRKVVHLESLLLDLDWGSLLSKPMTIEKLQIAGLHLDLVSFPDGTNNLNRMQREPTKLPEEIVIQALELGGVNVQIEQPNGQKLKVSDLAMAASLALDNPNQKLDLTLQNLSGTLDNPNVSASFQLAASARRNGADLEATLTPGTISVIAKALDQKLDLQIAPVTVTMKDGLTEMRFGGLTAGPVKVGGMRTLGRLPPPGAVGLGPGEHLVELTGVQIDHTGVNTLLGREALLSDVALDASVKGPAERLAVDGKVKTDGGMLALTGTIDARDLMKPIVHLVLEGSDLDTTKILAGETRPDLQTAFKATIDLTGLPPDHTLKIHADVAKTTVAGRTIDSIVIDASGKGDVLILEGLEITAFGQTLALDGMLDRKTQEFRGHLAMHSALGDAIQKARDAGVLITPLPPIDGSLDVDLAVAGRLKPKPIPPPGAESAPATPFDPKALIVNGRIDLSSLPIETLTLKGQIDGKDIVVKGPPGTNLPDKKVGLVDVDLDLLVEGGKPDGLKGRLDAKVGGVDTGQQTLDSAEVQVAFEGLRQDITIKAADERQALALDVAMKSLLDLEKREVDTTLERLYVKRGPAETRLEAPVTLALSQSPDGKQTVRVPPMKLALAGGTLDVAVKAELSKDENNPGANKVDAFDLSLDLDAIDLGRLAGLARRSTRGLAGKLDMSVRAQGTPQNPQLDFFGDLRGRMKTGAPFTAKFSGAMRDKVLDLELGLHDRGERTPLLSFDLMAPLNLPTAPGAKPSLGAGRFAVKASMPTTELSRLGALMPDGLPEGVDPGATLGLSLDLAGTTARPTGSWSLDFEGDLLRRRGYANAPARQKVAIAGELRPDGRTIQLDNDFDLHLDASAPAFVAHHTHGTFERSPLLASFLDRPWTLEAGLEKPIELAVLHDIGLAPRPIAGALSSEARLNGQAKDVLGTLSFGLASLKAGTAPVANIAGVITIGQDDIRVSQRADVAGLDALAAEIVIGVPGRGLRGAMRDRQRLMRAPLSGELRLVEHTIAGWKQALAKTPGAPALPDLPGQLGGVLTLGGDLTTPTASGAFAWDGFESAHGAPGRVALEIEATPATVGGGLALGGEREVTLRASIDRKELVPPRPGTDPASLPPLPIALVMKADQVDLLRLVPAFATAGQPWKLQGRLDWSMQGELLSSRNPAAPGLMPGSHVVGDLLISALDVAVPDTDRHIQDGRVAISATRDALSITGIELHEARYPDLPGFVAPPDETRGDRFVKISGRVPWTDLKIDEAHLAIETRDWLVLGLGFDGPEGELDLAMRVDAKNLTQPVKAIEVTLDDMMLYAPDRFIRAHYPQFPAYDDLVYLDASQRPSGVLPPPKGAKPPPDPNAPPAPPADPTQGLDIRLAIPNGMHVVFAAASPLEVKLKGQMDVKMRGADLNLAGRLDLTDGELGAMGRPFKLQRGVVTADGGLDTFRAEIVFAIAPHEIALRDIAQGAHGDLATITLVATAKTGLQTIFGGVSGPYLLDMATLLNTGRARMWGLPDVPASETVRFGNPDHGLVLTFIQTNLRNLVFMDRMNGWSESRHEPAEYGRLRFFDMQRFVDGNRWHFFAQPVQPGQNRMELGYDWLLAETPSTVLGFGPHLGTDLRAGLGLSLEWASED